MPDTLTRWRTRCERFIASAKWLPWRRRYVPGLRKALEWSADCSDPLVTIVTLKSGVLFYVPVWEAGLCLALDWLGEEYVRA